MDVDFTMRQYVQSDLEADQVATAVAELIIGGSLASVDVTGEPAAGLADQRRESGWR